MRSLFRVLLSIPSQLGDMYASACFGVTNWGSGEFRLKRYWGELG